MREIKMKKIITFKKNELKMGAGIMFDPTIDMAVGVTDSFQHWRVAFIFIDIIVNIKQKSAILAFGIPYWKAKVIYFTLNK